MGKSRWSGQALLMGVLVVLVAAALALALAAYSGSNGVSYAAMDDGASPADVEVPVSSDSIAAEAGRLARSRADEAIIIDHLNTDITLIPQAWLEQAKQDLHIVYGHTSHGSQLTTGMTDLVGFANDGGLGMSFPWNFFAFNSGGSGGALDLREPFSGDLGSYPEWVNQTAGYLGTVDPQTGRGTENPDINVVIWSWCGQLSGLSAAEVQSKYLVPMSQLEDYYFGVMFVYMTGHADGTGENGNLHQRNQQIRDYCIANDKILYDFYQIELYDPDDSYFGDKGVTDECYYDSDGNGSLDKNWATDWQNAHTPDVDWYSCVCQHSQPLNCNQKAYAAWWLWARLAGWDGGGAQPEPSKVASTETAVSGQIVTYTITVQGLSAPLGATIYLTDVVPAGLSYVPGSLSSTGGVVDDSLAPVLHWTGTLNPAPPAKVTYDTVVDTNQAQVITNNAVIASPGYEPITVTASITTLGIEPPDLSTSYKMANPEQGGIGDPIAYTLVVRNSGSLSAETIWLTDTIPVGLAYVPGSLSSTGGVVSDAAAPTLTWSGVLSPTSVVTITYDTLVETDESQVITNNAMIVSPGYEPITITASITTLGIEPPDLSTSYKMANPEQGHLGDPIAYTLVVRNSGGLAQETFWLTDTIPAGLSYVPDSLSSTGGVVDDSLAPALHWTGTLNPAPVVTITYAVVVDTDESQVITNNAVIASPGYEPIIVTASITTLGIEPPDLSTSYKMANPQQGGIGDPITYTLVVRNSGSLSAETIWLTDTIPVGLAYVPGSLSSTGGVVSDAAAPTLTWSGVLSPTSVVTITYVATVANTSPAAITNQAEIVLPGYPPITRSTTILVNPLRHYLPLVFRNG